MECCQERIQEGGIVVEIMPPTPLKILATPLSAVYQHCLMKGVSFVAKLQ